MSLLKEILLKKKFFEAQEEIEAFLEEHDFESGSIIQSLDFTKEIFTEKDMVIDFAESHYLTGSNIEEDKKKYSIILFDEIAFIDSTMKQVPIREGIIANIGLLRPMSAENPVLFSDKSKNIKLNSDHPYIIEIARVVKGFHPNYGEVEITKKDLISFKNNFDNNVVGVDISIDFDHETREAAGWIKEVFLSEDGTVLLAGVRWTPKGALSLSNREFRYFSPEFNRNWIHPHTGKAHGPTLLGGGLVNRPFLKMDAIVSLKENSKKGVNEVSTISLSDHEKKITEMQMQINDFKLSEQTAKSTISGLKSENEKLTIKLSEMEARIEKEKKENEINKLFSEQKINKAQKDALLEGKDIMEVLSLSEKMNTAPKGIDGGKAAITLSDKELELCQKLNLTPEEFAKYGNGEVQ